MSRILLSWELGGGYGHIPLLGALAAALNDLGHRCAFALREVTAAEEFGLSRYGPVFQAPRFPARAQRPVRVQVSYASLLHNTGFDDRLALTANLRAWRALLQTLRTDALIAEHAPVSLVAARSLGLVRATIGSSFTVPPLARPFPSFQPRLAVDPAILAHNEHEVLGVINPALGELQLPGLQRLQEIFEGSDPQVFGYRELDVYEERRTSRGFRGLPDHSQGEPPAWPQTPGPRLFAYLRPYPYLDALLRALKASRLTALVRVADVVPDALAPYARPGLVFTTRSVHLRRAAEDCDAMLHYAPAGTTTEMLLAGKPGLLLPVDVEKGLVARRAAGLGAALVCEQPDEAQLAAALDRLVSDDALRRAAEGFAERYRAQDRAAIAREYAVEFVRRL